MDNSNRTGSGNLIISSGCISVLTNPIIDQLSSITNYGSVTLNSSVSDVSFDNFGYMNIVG